MQKRNTYFSSSSQNVEKVRKLLAGMEGVELTEHKIRSVLAGCAKQLLKSRLSEEAWEQWRWLIDGLKKFESPGVDAEACQKSGESFTYVYKEDLLGFLYLSLRAFTERKRSGSYYTPNAIAKKVADRVSVKDTQSVLDPACGTGSILLELTEKCNLEQLYGYDIDPIAVAITRINMALAYGVCDKAVLTEHFAERDFLQDGSPKKMDVILGNPPWGSAFTQEEKTQLQKKYRTAGKKAIESGDLFVEQSLKGLQPGGILCFVLPEALLHVKTHRMVRSLILEQSHVISVEYLGEVFERVQCPSVIITLEKKSAEKITPDDEHLRDEDAGIVRLSPERFLFDVSEEEFALLQKLSRAVNMITLKGKASFALGIVTGNNEKHLQKQKMDGCEPILRGTDIERFRIKETASYICFSPAKYQQIAPIELYRAKEKLLYRFVGERPVFAYDNKQRLTLNSCNIVIPSVEGLDMRYIMAVFNSRVIGFWHRRYNHSMKLLRTHIEGFPIPVASSGQQQEVIRLVELLQDSGQNAEERNCIYEQLDAKITELFGLTDKEYELVKQIDNI